MKGKAHTTEEMGSATINAFWNTILRNSNSGGPSSGCKRPGVWSSDFTARSGACYVASYVTRSGAYKSNGKNTFVK